jgi:hypothetical protein
MLALLFGAQLCTLANCLPSAHAHVLHPCCAAAAARAGHGSHAPARDCARPCCGESVAAHAPQLDGPLAHDAHELLASLAIVAAPELLAAPARGTSPPAADATPPDSPPRSAAGTRAPPRA